MLSSVVVLIAKKQLCSKISLIRAETKLSSHLLQPPFPKLHLKTGKGFHTVQMLRGKACKTYGKFHLNFNSRVLMKNVFNFL